MKNLENLFVPYELALKLKENRFKEDCLAAYSFTSKQIIGIGHYTDNGQLLAPLYQQAFDWFREKYGIEIWVEYSGKTGKSRKRKYYSLVNYVQGTIKEGFFYNHKEALNKAIEEALKLI